jgi:hypothetical protein
MFVCDGCGVAVRWKSPVPVPANFDSSLCRDIEVLRGRDADAAILTTFAQVAGAGA